MTDVDGQFSVISVRQIDSKVWNWLRRQFVISNNNIPTNCDTANVEIMKICTSVFRYLSSKHLVSFEITPAIKSIVW